MMRDVELANWNFVGTQEIEADSWLLIVLYSLTYGSLWNNNYRINTKYTIV